MPEGLPDQLKTIACAKALSYEDTSPARPLLIPF